ncbi:hypothetical protein Y032_0606g577 [Ancylostoma ceylanicum]|uniref:Integrase zinc-binding domain-containing protein n=1 Tax=Ancylostoma ceylanicum TaxID=53326 RepID=A0A016WNJ6_9BILA|nr:hypothetical protein Y032_0606g577 [Ancylostoma ceylanicum]
MKMLARSYVNWPSLDADIESLVTNCTTCAMVAKNPVKPSFTRGQNRQHHGREYMPTSSDHLTESTTSSSWTHSRNGPKSSG